MAAEKGSVSAEHSSNDLTPFMMIPLDPGADGRGYTSQEARVGMQRKMEASLTRADSISDLGLPKAAIELRKEAKKVQKGMLSASTRGPADGYRSGQDVTYTENQGLTHSSRTADDTPEPRSPNPYSSKESLTQGVRYERAHQGAYRFSGEAGRTVHAPTQANQVIDTEMERFAAAEKGGFTYRMDTFSSSSVYAARPTGEGWEMKQASYMRRNVASTDSVSDTQMDTGATASTSNNSSGKKRAPAQKRKSPPDDGSG